MYSLRPEFICSVETEVCRVDQIQRGNVGGVGSEFERQVSNQEVVLEKIIDHR